MTQWVYHFDAVDKPDQRLLGGKGAHLADMTKAKLPVPPGFIVSTVACGLVLDNGGTLPQPLRRQIEDGMIILEQTSGRRFGHGENPLLVSVRSGAPVSMPGMMDTVLNLGLNDVTVEGLAAQTHNPAFAYDCYRRFIVMYGQVVLGIPRSRFGDPWERGYAQGGTIPNRNLAAEPLPQRIAQYQRIVVDETGHPFPQKVEDQLMRAIEAVFRSWRTPRAQTYRKAHQIADDLGTAVTVQGMVFGNLGEDSATGVVFTRNPSTGEPEMFGEYLTNAQGEDVVAGIQTPNPIHRLADEMPAIYRQLLTVGRQLEHHYRDVQDIEFTIEQGRLYILQTRNAKRAGQAAVRIATDFVQEGIIDREDALTLVDPVQLDQLLHPSIDEGATMTVLGQGLPASPGAASGHVAFDPDDAVHRAARGEQVILVRPETTSDDIHGILAASGILTSRGGMTSHAAVVARGMGKPCVCGCQALSIRTDEKICQIADTMLTEGDIISIDGATGRVMLNEVPVHAPQMSEAFHLLMGWADHERSLGVRANADTVEDARLARDYGAEGIGLCRTEHMFLSPDRMPIVQSLILAADERERRGPIERLRALQQADFYGILKAMDGLPVTIRLLDPPLHEFLPDLHSLTAQQAELRVRCEYEPDNHLLQAERERVSHLLKTVQSLHERNPMLGHRGCRLGITFPDVYAMQVWAIFHAAMMLLREGGRPQPEILIPFVGHVEELRRMRRLVDQTAQQIFKEHAREIPYLVGTMIELPRAALIAAELAKESDFFSFGSNDLTQTTLGYSRDDAESKFLPIYLSDKLLSDNPFAVLDEQGVGKLIEMAAKHGREINPSLKLGLCGEHGGEKRSIAFCHKAHLTYVSCSPFRVPLARLAAAQAAVLSRYGPSEK